LAPQPGLEPGTERLTAVCSTTELSGNMFSCCYYIADVDCCQQKFWSR
jgi:hypothetical protein